MARKITPFVIAYDFDGTLSEGNMQEHDFLPELDITPEEFWKEAKNIAKKQNGDEILAYMQLMLEKAKHKKISVRKKTFEDFGKKLTFFPGVTEWFERINKYAEEKKIPIEHFIISSGLREMIRGTKIANNFKEIYASGFMYDHNGLAHWPALAINYTTKTQYLFRINKGSLDVYDNSQINKFVPEDERNVPFSNMLFIGDGETDIPSMRLVKSYGGHSIAVYPKGKHGAAKLPKELINTGRVNLAAVADYTEGSAIDTAVKAMIDKVVATRIINNCTA